VYEIVLIKLKPN